MRLFGEAAKELGARHGLQQTNHGDGNRALLNELDEAIENVVAVRIEAENEPAHHFDPVALDGRHAVEQIAAGVLMLLGGGQARLIRRLDAEKHGSETRLAHGFQQAGIVSEVDRGFGDEAKHVSMRPLPGGDRRQQRAAPGFVADEVVVDDEDRTVQAGRRKSSSSARTWRLLERGRRP